MRGGSRFSWNLLFDFIRAPRVVPRNEDERESTHLRVSNWLGLTQRPRTSVGVGQESFYLNMIWPVNVEVKAKGTLRNALRGGLYEK